MAARRFGVAAAETASCRSLAFLNVVRGRVGLLIALGCSCGL